MKKNLMLSIWALTIVFYFCAESPGVFAQEPATGAPLPPPKTAPPSKQETLDIVFGAFKTLQASERMVFNECAGKLDDN